MPQLVLVDCGPEWTPEIEEKTRLVALAIAKRFGLQSARRDDFISDALLHVYRKYMSGALRHERGIVRTVTNLGRSAVRDLGRPRNQPMADVTEIDAPYEANINQKAMLDIAFRKHPWAAVVLVALDAGLSMRVISDAFEISVEELSARLETERESLRASVL